MKKQLKKPFLMMAVTALVLVGTLKVGGAMAYFTLPIQLPAVLFR